MSKTVWKHVARQLLARNQETPEAWDAAEALRKRFRDSLRVARAKVQADAEGFEVVVHAIERIGQHFAPEGTGLGSYEDALVALVETAGLGTTDLGEQLFLLRQTRNDAAHRGSFARNAAREAVLVALRLEDALSAGWGDIELRHVMVRDPVTAQPGDTLGDIRQAMLEHAFTAIPARVRGRWFVLTDQWLAMKLAGKGSSERGKVLATKIDALSQGDLTPLSVEPLPGSTLVSRLVDGGHLQRPLILVASPPNLATLAGIVAPADLL